MYTNLFSGVVHLIRKLLLRELVLLGADGLLHRLLKDGRFLVAAVRVLQQRQQQHVCFRKRSVNYRLRTAARSLTFFMSM